MATKRIALAKNENDFLIVALLLSHLLKTGAQTQNDKYHCFWNTLLRGTLFFTFMINIFLYSKIACQKTR